jgi:hypothetical protein
MKWYKTFLDYQGVRIRSYSYFYAEDIQFLHKKKSLNKNWLCSIHLFKLSRNCWYKERDIIIVSFLMDIFYRVCEKVFGGKKNLAFLFGHTYV